MRAIYLNPQLVRKIEDKQMTVKKENALLNILGAAFRRHSSLPTILAASMKWFVRKGVSVEGTEPQFIRTSCHDRRTMNAERQRVYLVVDRSFGQRLTALAKVGHVWAVASAVNSPVIQAFWQDDRADKEAELMGPGITAFQEMYVGEPKERLCARLSEELDIHHGEGSGQAPWDEIEVFGVPLTDELRTRFGDLGGQTFVPTPEGFICRRKNALLDDDVR